MKRDKNYELLQLVSMCCNLLGWVQRSVAWRSHHSEHISHYVITLHAQQTNWTKLTWVTNCTTIVKIQM